MKKKAKIRAKSKTNQPAVKIETLRPARDRYFSLWLLGVLVITGICLFPMLNNEFTNWDDEFYIINNQLLRGPDWKGIFSEQVLGNYHPLTILSYAFNYAVSGLNPFSYLLVNYLFHIVNTLLVFYFIWNISGKNKFIAAFVALIFGVHPMHVESVAWIAERKDMLYTFFFLLSLIQYWRFLSDGKKSHFWICFVFFVLSLLSKPAAIVLPFVLLLLDHWKGRSITFKVITEKIPFYLLSFLFGIITVKIQSPTAMADLQVFTIADRLFFACYVLMIYFIRFFIPQPLSAFHPFPASGNLGWPVLISPLFVVAMLAILWFLRKNKVVVFGILFYVINLLLVLQIISIGLTIVSERYTYVPYIGLAFMIAMLVSRIRVVSTKAILAAAAIFIVVMGIIAYQRTQVWKNSGTLWTDALKTYPKDPYARTNRANYLSRLASRPDQKPFADSIYKLAYEDCAIALSMKPNHVPALEFRALLNLDRKQIKEAFADANALIRLKPDSKIAYDVRASCYSSMNEPAKALADYDKCILLNPDDHRSYNNRGTILMNSLQKANEALSEFTKAISINPLGHYYLNRSFCYYKLGNMQKAKEDALIATQKGTAVPDNYKSALQLK